MCLELGCLPQSRFDLRLTRSLPLFQQDDSAQIPRRRKSGIELERRIEIGLVISSAVALTWFAITLKRRLADL